MGSTSMGMLRICDCATATLAAVSATASGGRKRAAEAIRCQEGLWHPRFRVPPLPPPVGRA
eukprot:1860097-Prymnesium_polylepis.1